MNMKRALWLAEDEEEFDILDINNFSMLLGIDEWYST